MKLNPINLMLILFFIQIHSAFAIPDDGYREFQLDPAILDAIINNINNERAEERQRYREEAESNASALAPVTSIRPRHRPDYLGYRREQEYLDLLTNRSEAESRNHSCVRQFITENPNVNITDTEVFRYFSLCPLSDAYQTPTNPNRDDPASRRLTYEPTSFCECVNERAAMSGESGLGPYRPISSRGLRERAEQIQNLMITVNLDKLASDYEEFAENYHYIKNAPDFHSLYNRPIGDSVQPNSLARCDPDELAALPSHLASENICSVKHANDIISRLALGLTSPEPTDTATGENTLETASDRLASIGDIFRTPRSEGAGSSGLHTTAMNAREAASISNLLSPTTACRDYELMTSREACPVTRTSSEVATPVQTERINILSQEDQDELFNSRVEMTNTLMGVLDHMHKNEGSLENYPTPDEEFLERVKGIVLSNPFLRREYFPDLSVDDITTEHITVAMGRHLNETIYPALQRVIELSSDSDNPVRPENINMNLTLQALTLVNYPDYLNSLRGCRRMLRRITNLCEAISKGNPQEENPLITPFLQNAELMRPLIEASDGEDPDGLIQSLITDSSQVACSEYSTARIQNRGQVPVFASSSDQVADVLTADLRSEEDRLTQRTPEHHVTTNVTRNMIDRITTGGGRPPTISRDDSLIPDETRQELNRFRSEQLASTQRANAVERARQIAELSGDNSDLQSGLASTGSGVVETGNRVVYANDGATIERPQQEALFSAAQVRAGQAVTSSLRQEMTAEELATLSPHEQRLLEELDRLSAREAKLEEQLRESEKEREEIRNQTRIGVQDRLIASLKEELKNLKTEMADLSKSLSQPARAVAQRIAEPAPSAARISDAPIRSNSKPGSSESNGGATGNSNTPVASAPGPVLPPSGGGVRNTTATPLAPTNRNQSPGVSAGSLSTFTLTNRLNSSDASISQLAESQNAVVYRQTNMAGFVEKIVFKTVDGRVLFENGEPVIEETQLISMEETEIQAWLAQMNQSSDGRFPASTSDAPELIELEERSTPNARHNNLIQEIERQRELLETED